MAPAEPVITKPFLRWAGSKRTVLPKLQQYFPETVSRYLEPFAGSACLFFSLAPQSGVLGDLNDDLIKTFSAVRDQPREIGDILARMKVTEHNYYRIRRTDPTSISTEHRAARFIYLNRFCFNGLYRTNAAGDFNVPFGRPKTLSVPTGDELARCAKLLKRVKLVAGDFEQMIRDNVRRGDFVYMDPPFYRSSRRVFRQYTARPFESADLARLSKLLKFIDRSGAQFVVSYSSCAEAREAFSKWNRFRIRLRRNISGSPHHRRVSEEFVITNMPHLKRRAS